MYCPVHLCLTKLNIVHQLNIWAVVGSSNLSSSSTSFQYTYGISDEINTWIFVPSELPELLHNLLDTEAWSYEMNFFQWLVADILEFLWYSDSCIHFTF